MPSRHVLFIKLGALGDILYALPAPTALKRVSTDYHVTWVIGEKLASVIHGHPDIDRIITIDEANIFSSVKFAQMAEALRFGLRAAGRYESVFISHRDFRYAFLLWPFVIGPIFQLSMDEVPRYPTWFRHDVKVPPLTLHESVAIRELIKAGEPQIADHPWRASLNYITESSLGEPGSIVIHLGGGENTKTEFTLKRWPHWTHFLISLLQKTNRPVVLVGAPSEKSLAFQIVKEVQAELNLIGHSQKGHLISNLVGKTSLRQLVATIRTSRAFIGVDSGPLHIADALNIPSIGLFGPTSPVSWGLLGNEGVSVTHDVPCSPCYKDDGHFPQCQFYHRCMVGITPEVVLKAVDSYL